MFISKDTMGILMDINMCLLVLIEEFDIKAIAM